MATEVKRRVRCKICRKPIEAMLTDIPGASGTLCLECAGATLADFVDKNEFAENEIEMMRTFHGKGPWD